MPLPFGLCCTMFCRAQEIEDASSGDNLIVTAHMILPRASQSSALHPLITFNSRLAIMGESLIQNWGHSDSKRESRRHGERNTKGPTWKAAFDAAEEFLLTEYNRLLVMLLNREKALYSEGCDIASAHRLIQSMESPHDEKDDGPPF